MAPVSPKWSFTVVSASLVNLTIKSNGKQGLLRIEDIMEGLLRSVSTSTKITVKNYFCLT